MCTEHPLARFQCWWATSQVAYLIGQGSHHGDEAVNGTLMSTHLYFI